MKNTSFNLVLFFSFFILAGCNRNNNSEIPKLSINAGTFLRFQVKNCKTPANFTIAYNSVFPNEQYLWNIGFEKDTVAILRLTINHPGAVYFFNSTVDGRCFALPNDTLDIWLDLDSTKNTTDNIIFKGKTASISNYLTRAKLATFLEPVDDESISEFNSKVDFLTHKALVELKAFNKKEPLPDWFVKMEETDIAYSGATDKMNQFTDRFFYFHQFIQRPADFVDQLHVKIDNPDAIFSGSYFSFLCWVTAYQYDTLIVPPNDTPENFYNFVKENIYSAPQYLHSGVRDFFISQRIGGLLNNSFYQKIGTENKSLYHQTVDTLLSFAKANFKDTSLLGYLLTYQKDQLIIAKEMEILNLGVAAPGFKLKDMTGKSISLSDFKGRLVCINFWSSSCSACITSIPKKNQLYENYAKKGVVFLNIYLETENEKWVKLIKENNFDGIHLICKGNWTNLLYKSYYISGIPHYVLVDKNGKIIKNKVSNIKELEDLIKMNI